MTANTQKTQKSNFPEVAQNAAAHIQSGIIVGYDGKGQIGFMTSNNITAPDIMFLLAVIKKRVLDDVLAAVQVPNAQNDGEPEPRTPAKPRKARGAKPTVPHHHV